MITVRIERDQQSRITGFSVSGHSGYAEHGSDIVCAGVSAITQTTIIGLQDVLGINCQGQQSAGKLSCRLPGCLGDRQPMADLLLRTMLSGLSALADAYADYIRILD
jgi:hypothetical protein